MKNNTNINRACRFGIHRRTVAFLVTMLSAVSSFLRRSVREFQLPTGTSGSFRSQVQHPHYGLFSVVQNQRFFVTSKGGPSFPSSTLTFATNELSTALKRDVAPASYAIPTKQQVEDQLFQELTEWRRRTADELQRPIYMIASNQLLETIAKRKPKDLEHLSLLSGFGKFKVEKYGQMIVEIVSKYPHPDDPKGVVFDPNDLVDTEEFWKVARSKKKKPSSSKKTSSNSGSARGTIRGGKIGVLSPEEAAEIDKKAFYSWDDLNSEKQAAAHHIIAGNNVFITGSAGTGKSFLLRYVIQELIQKHGEESVAVTGPTGISAVNIGGQTVHSFAGIGLGTGDRAKLIQKVLKNRSCVDRWLKTKVLVIDEISMLDRWLFELLDELARTIRNNQTPFGGLQLIVVGDFMQLPPVRTVSEFENKNFCFQSDVWEAAGLNTGQGTVYLEKVVRQDDEEFVKYLNEVRVGIVSPSFQRQLQMCMPPFKPKPNNGIIPTKLYATNKQVDNENLQHLLALPGEIVTMFALDKWKQPPSKSSMTAICKEGVEKLIPEKIDLKVGAQVMLLRNRSRMTYGGNIKTTGPSLVNGSRGRIVSFTESVARPGMMIPTVQFDNGMVTTIGPVEYVFKGPGGDGELVRYQVPLKLAWASTVHKSQGCTLTCAELVLDKAFDYGQVYVALSRVKDLKGLWLSSPILPQSVKSHPAVLQFYGYID